MTAQVPHAEEQQAAKKKLSVRTIILVVLAVLVTLFAVQNWQPVSVWPLGTGKPLTLVIGISFVLGALIGWLLHSVLGGRRSLRDM